MYLKTTASILLPFFLFTFFSCSQSDEIFNSEKWQKRVLAHRADTNKDYANSPDSPFAGIERFTLDTNNTHFLELTDEHFQLSSHQTSHSLIEIHFLSGNWQWSAINKDFRMKGDGLGKRAGTLPNRNVEAAFLRFSFSIYPLDNRMIIIIFDPQREAIKNFRHLFYFDVDPNYHVKAKLSRFENPQKIKMLTSRNLIKTYFRYAKIGFSIKGEKQTLMAYKTDISKGKGKGWLFIPFKDATNEKETYAAGRFLEINDPGGDEFILDFNLAFNPLCNYAHVYNCSYPPPENHLKIPIYAGEKTYPDSLIGNH